MDEDLKAYLDVMRSEIGAMRGETSAYLDVTRSEIGAMRGEISALHGEIGAMRGEISALRGQVNDGQERLLNRLTSLEQDFLNTKGFLVGDAIVSGRRWLDMDERVTRLERGQKDGPAGTAP